MLSNEHGPPLQAPLGANRSRVWIYRSSHCSSAAFLSLDTMLSSVRMYWSEQNDDISMGKREVLSYLLGHFWKTACCFWKVTGKCVLGEDSQPLLSSLVSVLRHEHKKCMLLLHVFVFKQALWELLSSSHLNFNFYGQNRKESSLPVCYLLYSPVLFSSDEWGAISILYRAQEMQCDWKPFASLLKFISQFCGFAVMTNLSVCGKCYFQKFSALCAGHIKESSCFLASRMEFLLSSWNAILQ